MDGKPHDILPTVAKVCNDDAEVLALSILRFVAAGYLTSDVACWDAAHDGAERLLGTVAGPQMVALMTGIMRAIRREREGDWRFMPAPCCRVTEDEQRLIELIALARSGCRKDLETGAAVLMRRETAPGLSDAVWAASSMLSSTSGRLVAAASERDKTVVLH
jgi:hypothetical protein